MAIRALINEGDEVIIPIPSFVCYGPLVTMAGGVPVYLETPAEDGFKLTPERLAAAITEKTKLLVLPYPNNPTGAIMTREDLEGIAAVLRDTDIVVLSDEIYAELTYGCAHTSIATLPDMRERTIITSGFSKAYAMTGWRLGYIAAPAPLAKEMLKLHQYGIMCAPTTSQFAALEAIRNGDEDIAMMREEYNRRRIFLLHGLAELGIECYPAEGAFYLYPCIKGYGLSSDEFCERLLHEGRCAIVPGTAFGEAGEGYARISYAYSMKHLQEALRRIGAFLDTLKK
jgi:aminotransferase